MWAEYTTQWETMKHKHKLKRSGIHENSHLSLFLSLLRWWKEVWSRWVLLKTRLCGWMWLLLACKFALWLTDDLSWTSPWFLGSAHRVKLTLHVNRSKSLRPHVSLQKSGVRKKTLHMGVMFLWQQYLDNCMTDKPPEHTMSHRQQSVWRT